MAEKLRGAAVLGRVASAARVSRNAIVWGGAALFFAVGGTAARAQQNEAAQNPFSVEVGTYMPVEADGRNAGGRFMWLAEASYTIQNLPEYNSAGVFSIGYTERDDLRIIPFTISQIVRGRDTVFTQNNYFWGVGIGLYSVRLGGPDASGTNKVLFGFDLQGGIDINPRLFLDVKYHYISKYDGKFVGGFQVGVGGRFEATVARCSSGPGVPPAPICPGVWRQSRRGKGDDGDERKAQGFGRRSTRRWQQVVLALLTLLAERLPRMPRAKAMRFGALVYTVIREYPDQWLWLHSRSAPTDRPIPQRR